MNIETLLNTKVNLLDTEAKIYSLDTPLYSGDIKSLVANGAVNKDDVWKLMKGEVDTIPVVFDKIFDRKKERLVKSYKKLFEKGGFKNVHKVKEEYLLAELSFPRQGFVLETTVSFS